jgi:hypothetical protein
VLDRSLFHVGVFGAGMLNVTEGGKVGTTTIDGRVLALNGQGSIENSAGSGGWLRLQQ